MPRRTDGSSGRQRPQRYRGRNEGRARPVFDVVKIDGQTDSQTHNLSKHKTVVGLIIIPKQLNI